MLITFQARAAFAALCFIATACAVEGEAVPTGVAVDHADLSANRKTVRDSIRALTAKGSETLEVDAKTQMVVVRDGNAEVLVAKKNADGTVSRRCVGSVGEGDAFLGSAEKLEVTKAAER